MRRFALALIATLSFLALPSLSAPSAFADEGFVALFDGQSLAGWTSPDMSWWSVEDGAITARSTAEKPCKSNQFLAWGLGEMDDFELKLRFRLSGHASANSGVQFRSAIQADGHAVGYQADIDLAGQWLGALYDEHTDRRMLAKRGERTLIDPQGKRTVQALDGGGAKPPAAGPDGWSEYHISARGTRLTLRINGEVTAEVVDDERAQRDLSGRLALQLHSGPATTVQFKDIRLKRLPLAPVEGVERKRLVMVAGAPSHGPGEHEFNAGVALLRRCLQQGAPQVLAVAIHDAGWPKDPTAFDNADGVVLYMDGGKRHPIAGRLPEVRKLMERGVGLMCMHFAVEVEDEPSRAAFKEWIGGHYEAGYSSNPHWEASLTPHPTHPITRGVKASAVQDEWYFCMRFRGDEDSITPLLRATPTDKTREMNGWPRASYPHIQAMKGRSETLMWAIERADGGRGVGFTGGHWHRNWALEDNRKAVLNAMVWVARAEVPQDGVASRVTDEQMTQGLDPKPRRK